MFDVYQVSNVKTGEKDKIYFNITEQMQKQGPTVRAMKEKLKEEKSQ